MENKLTQKLVDIMGEIESVEKDGHNKNQNYDYFSEALIMALLRKKLKDKHILFVPGASINKIENVCRNEKEYALTSINSKHRFIDAETGEILEIEMPGQGQDGGDKGIYKAITGSVKYALMKTFMISDGSDPEADEKIDKELNSNIKDKEPENYFDALTNFLLVNQINKPCNN